MSAFVSVDDAIRARFANAHELLTGVRVEDDPFPSQTSTRTVVGTGQSGLCCPPVELFVPFGGQIHPVVVFQENREGHHVDIPNTIEFQAVRTRFRNEETITGVDIETLGSVKTQGIDGKDVWGPNLKRIRPQAIPESLYYDFHIETRNYRLSVSLLSMLTSLFPPLGNIEITRANGCVVFFDVIRTTNPFRSSPFDATLTPGDPGVRKYRWTAQYEFEAYTDNTLQGKYRQTITSRCVTPVSVLGSTEVVGLVEQP